MHSVNRILELIGIRSLFIFLITASAIYMAITLPFKGLTEQGHKVLAVVIISLAFWVFKKDNMPYFIGFSILAAGCLILRIPINTITIGFTNNAIWVLIPALFSGFAIVKTGLGRRITYFVLRVSGINYPAICLGWFITGVILSVLTPSIIVRLAILMPIAMNIVEACKVPYRSKGSALICFMAWGAAIFPGNGWMTGSLWGIIMMGFYPDEIKHHVTPEIWLKYMFIPWLIIAILWSFLIFVFFRPKKSITVNKDIFNDQYRKMGSITRKEILCGIILLTTFIMYSIEKWTGFKTVEVALMSLAALFITGIIDISDVSSGINWDIVGFIAITMGLPSILNKAGVSEWIRPYIQCVFFTMAHNPILFLIGLTSLFWFVRFIDVPWGFTSIAIFSSLFMPLFEIFNLHPVFISIGIVAGGNSFFLPYQQPFLMIGDAITKSEAWSARQAAIAGALYGVCVIGSIVLSGYYWKITGLIN